MNVYNVHGPVHLAEDVCKLGCLDSFSSFPSENDLGSIKKKLHSKKRPLAQVFKRMAQVSSAERQKEKKKASSVGNTARDWSYQHLTMPASSRKSSTETVL